MQSDSTVIRIKDVLVTVISLALGIRILLLLADPGTQEGLAFYASNRAWLNWFYYLTGWIEYPVSIVVSYASAFIPALNDWLKWYPYVPMATLFDWVLTVLPDKTAEVARVQSILMGQYSTISTVSIAFYSALGFVFNFIWMGVTRIFWIVFTEVSFANHKEKKLKKEIEAKQTEISSLDDKYHNLSKEASKLKDYVITDELTQIYNKRFFLDNMKEFFEKSRKSQALLSLVMIDIDHFKKLNDTYGHMFGDTVLKAVAQTAQSVTPGNCYCCRFGGEELGIIMPFINPEDTQNTAETARKALMALKFKEQPDLTVTASFGVATVYFDSPKSKTLQKFDDVVKLADDELYKAKLNGRNQVSSTVFR